MFSETQLIFDHSRHSVLLLTHADLEAADGDRERAQTAAEAKLDELEQRLRRATPRVPQGQRFAERKSPLPGREHPLIAKAAYQGAVQRVKEYIRAGDCYQVVPSRRIARSLDACPFDAYRALRSINPSPYMFYLALGDFAVAGASPELLVRVEHGEVAIHPIA